MSLTVRFLFLAVLLIAAASLSVDAKTLRPKNFDATVKLVTNKNGGAVVTQPLSLYFFYYGDFSAATRPQDSQTPAVFKQFVTDISDTTYLNVVSQYTDGKKNPATHTINYAGETFITGYPNGKVLQSTTHNCFEDLLKKWLKDYNVPVNNHTQYYIIYSSDVTYKNGVCDAETGNPACGYHTFYTDKNDQKILWGITGSSTAGCANQDGPYNLPTQSAYDTLSHEIFETISDPYIDAWIDADGEEIGDKCTDYGKTKDSTFKQGAKYNLLLNGHEYLVQTEWSNEIKGCSLSRGSAPSKGPTPSVAASPAARSVTLTPSPSTLVAPSADPSRSEGASRSASRVKPPTPSISVSATVAPSLDFSKGACFDCPNIRCDFLKSVEKVCRKKLHGRLTSSEGVACCVNASSYTSFSFDWIQPQAVGCDYPLSLTKKYRLCNALGGNVDCAQSTGNASGVHLTCSK